MHRRTLASGPGEARGRPAMPKRKGLHAAMAGQPCQNDDHNTAAPPRLDDGKRQGLTVGARSDGEDAGEDAEAGADLLGAMVELKTLRVADENGEGCMPS